MEDAKYKDRDSINIVRKANLSYYCLYVAARYMLYTTFDICKLIYVNNVYVSEIFIKL